MSLSSVLDPVHFFVKCLVVFLFRVPPWCMMMANLVSILPEGYLGDMITQGASYVALREHTAGPVIFNISAGLCLLHVIVWMKKDKQNRVWKMNTFTDFGIMYAMVVWYVSDIMNGQFGADDSYEYAGAVFFSVLVFMLFSEKTKVKNLLPEHENVQKMKQEKPTDACFTKSVWPWMLGVQLSACQASFFVVFSSYHYAPVVLYGITIVMLLPICTMDHGKIIFGKRQVRYPDGKIIFGLCIVLNSGIFFCRMFTLVQYWLVMIGFTILTFYADSMIACDSNRLRQIFRTLYLVLIAAILLRGSDRIETLMQFNINNETTNPFLWILPTCIMLATNRKFVRRMSQLVMNRQAAILQEYKHGSNGETYFVTNSKCKDDELDVGALTTNCQYDDQSWWCGYWFLAPSVKFVDRLCLQTWYVVTSNVVVAILAFVMYKREFAMDPAFSLGILCWVLPNVITEDIMKWRFPVVRRYGVKITSYLLMILVTGAGAYYAMDFKNERPCIDFYNITETTESRKIRAIYHEREDYNSQERPEIYVEELCPCLDFYNFTDTKETRAIRAIYHDYNFTEAEEYRRNACTSAKNLLDRLHNVSDDEFAQLSRKKAEEKRAAAEKKAADERAAAEKKAADERAAAEKKAADERAAAEKKAAETNQDNSVEGFWPYYVTACMAETRCKSILMYCGGLGTLALGALAVSGSSP